MSKKSGSVEKPDPQPKSGIFWAIGDELLVKSVAVRKDKTVEGKCDTDESHQDVWDKIRQRQRSHILIEDDETQRTLA